jgi:anti-anti-sigma factor
MAGSPHLRSRTSDGIIEVELLDKHILDEVVIAEIGQELTDAVDEAVGSPKVVLDFSQVLHLSSSALGMLITLNTRVQERGGALVLAHISDPIEEVFRITRLDRVLGIEATVVDARATLGGDA